MTDLREIETAVRQLHARLVDAVWRKDAAALAACFTTDAEWRIAGIVFRGRAEIEAGFARMLAGSERVLMRFGTPILEVGSEGASARTHVTELSAPKTAPAFRTLGIYYERFAQEDGRWRCAWRHFELHYAGATDLSGELFAQPDHGRPPALPERDAPTFSSAALRARG